MTLHYINLALIFEDIKCHQSHKICDLALIVTDMNEVIRWLQVAVLRAVLDAPTKSERLPVGGGAALEPTQQPGLRCPLETGLCSC